MTLNYWTFLLTLSTAPALAYALAHLPLVLRWRPVQPPLLLLVLLGLAARWLFLIVFPNPAGDLAWDAAVFRTWGDLVRDGRDVYAETSVPHPHLPFDIYLFAFAAQLEDWLGPHFFSWMRWPNILADLGILVLIYQGSLKLGRSPSAAFWLAFLWAVHPISIFTSVLHGQIHPVAIFFALLAWYLLRFWPGYRGAVLGGLALGFAVLVRTWTGLFIPVFLLLPSGLTNRALFLAWTAVAPALFALVYQLSFGSVNLFREILDYEEVTGHFGYPYAFGHYLNWLVPDTWLPFALAHGREILVGSLLVTAAVVIPRRNELASATALIATFYAATHGFGSQYLVWIVPFALMGGQVAMLGAYSAAAVPALFVYYWGTCGLQCPGRLSDNFEYWPLQWVWPVAIFWMLRDIARSIPVRETFASFLANLRGSLVVRRDV